MERAKRMLGALCAGVVLVVVGCGGGGSGGSSGSGGNPGPNVGHGIALASTPEVGLSTVSPTGAVSAPLIAEGADAFFSAYALSKSGLIAYGTVSAHSPRFQNFYVADANASSARLIASVPVEAPGRASLVWSPDETQIAYVVADADGYNVYRADIATSTSTRVTTVNDVSPQGSLAWDVSDQIYFVRGTTTDRTIYKIPSAGGTAVQVISGPGTLPSVSPDGHKLSFIDPTADDQSATHIYERDLVGGSERLVYTAPAGIILSAGYFDGNSTILYTRVLQFNPADILVGKLNTTTLQSTESPAPPTVFISATATPGSGVPQMIF